MWTGFLDRTSVAGMESIEEPKKRGALVRDREGDLWKRGNTRWTCQTPVDGVRVLRVGRLHWTALARMYGPLTVVESQQS